MVLLSIFGSAGYTKKTGRYMYTQRATFKSYKQGLTNPLAIDEMSVGPVHGFPIPAKHTLLAQLLKRGLPIPHIGTNIIQHIRHIREVKNRKTVKASLIQQAKKVLPLGSLLGIEIEHYPVHTSTLTLPHNSLGNYTHDGSLGTGGIELRRLTWVGLNGRINGILGLKPLLEGATVNHRCGLHIHVDIRNLPSVGNGTTVQCDIGETYDRLCQLYPVLKKLVPKSRLRSTYCRWSNNRRDSDNFRSNSAGNRYSALNYDSVLEHGTIEWRMQSGSTNVVKIESWALLCQYLTRWASVRQNSMPHNWDQFLAILPQWLASWCVLRRERLHGDLGPVDERVSSAVSQNE